MTNDGNDGVMTNGNVNDLMTGLEPFDGSINSPNETLLQNGPLPLQGTGTLNKGSPAVSSGNQMNVAKSMTSPGPDLSGFSSNRPPQVPVSSTSLATPPTSILNNAGSIRSGQPTVGVASNTPSSSVATSMSNSVPSSSFNNNQMQNNLQNMQNTNSSIMPTMSNSVFNNGPLSMAQSMTGLGQTMPMMSGDNFNAANQGYTGNMPMMAGNPRLNYNPMGNNLFRMNKLPNMNTFNPMNPMMGPMGGGPMPNMGIHENQQDQIMMGTNMPLNMSRMVSQLIYLNQHLAIGLK